MDTQRRIRDEHDYDIEYADTVDVDTSDLYVTIQRFRRLGSEASLDMIMLTPEEAQELSKALNNSVRKYKRAGRL